MYSSGQVTTGIKAVSTLVRCDHCGEMFDIKDVVPCTWKNIEPGKDFTWYYCKRCNQCFEKKEK